MADARPASNGETVQTILLLALREIKTHALPAVRSFARSPTIPA
jgi:hypothetical protein